jgi:uncharacterized protein (DUF885 family)
MVRSIGRRELLAWAAGTCAAAAFSPRVSAASSADASLTQLLDGFMDEDLRASPEQATALGLDVGPLANLRSQLNDRSVEQRATTLRRLNDQLRRLAAFEPEALSAESNVHRRTLLDILGNRAALASRFAYGEPGVGNPYRVCQMFGAYVAVPDFLDSKHPLGSAADVEAYIERIDAFARVLDGETSSVREDAGRGVVLPDFVLDRTLTQLRALRAVPVNEAVIVSSLARRAAEAARLGDRGGANAVPDRVQSAERLYAQQVLPALDRQIAMLAELRKRASHDAGAWRLPDGDAYYAACLRASTTTMRTADDLHRTGSSLVQELTSGLDAALSRQGLKRGSVAQRMRAIYVDPKFHYPNTEAGKTQLLEHARRLLVAIDAKLPLAFARLPKVPAEVRPVPKYLEEGSPAAFYHDPSIDGTRPGVYFVNLRDTGEIPTWYLPTVSFHEVTPGHHLQQVIAQEGSLPLIRKVMWSQAYGEGWGLYAEQIADELGMYEGDAWGRIGYLWAALLRACRLVVDTGLHAKRWSREQAIEWMTGNSGAAAPMIATEVERYCIQPGQACSYMIGKLTWVELRERAAARLGARFDLREFHDAGLRHGAVPLTVLESIVADYVKSKK